MLTSATREETLTPYPNECNSILMSGTKNMYPYPYIDVDERGHRLRILHALSQVSMMMNSPLIVYIYILYYIYYNFVCGFIRSVEFILYESVALK